MLAKEDEFIYVILSGDSWDSNVRMVGSLMGQYRMRVRLLFFSNRCRSHMIANSTRVGMIEDDFGEHRRVGRVLGGRPVRLIPDLVVEMTEIRTVRTSFPNRTDDVFQWGEITGGIYQNGPPDDAATSGEFQDLGAEFKAL